jgi:hypothetical protein
VTVLRVVKDPQPIVPGQAGQEILLANLDTRDTIYLSKRRTLSTSDDTLPPLGTIVLDGEDQWYASTLSTTASALLQVMIGAKSWSASPTQIAQQIAQGGIGVSNVQSFSDVNVGPGSSPDDFHTFGADGRIWAAHLSFAMATNGSAATSTFQAYSALSLNAGKRLLVIELNLGGPDSEDSGNADLSIPGMEVSAGDFLRLDINGGTSLGSDGTMRASVAVLCSFP